MRFAFHSAPHFRPPVLRCTAVRRDLKPGSRHINFYDSTATGALIFYMLFRSDNNLQKETRNSMSYLRYIMFL